MEEIFEPWSEFNVALTGATAALLGLVIVAASVNIRDIIGSRTLTSRLGASVAILLLALIVSGLSLVPGLDLPQFGALVVVVTIGAGLFQVTASRLIAAEPESGRSSRLLKALLGILPIAAYLIAGVLAIADTPAALHVAAAGTLLAIASAVAVSWVALVEVLR